MFCKFCGKEVENDSLFCRHCGESLGDEGNIANFLKSIKRRVAIQDTSFLKDKQGHLCFVVISKDQLSISIVNDDVNNIDMYDCSAIIALLRYDCHNSYGYHYNHFFNLGYFDDKLNPISKVEVKGYSIQKVDAELYSPAWGYIQAKNRYDETVNFTIFKNTKLINWH